MPKIDPDVNALLSINDDLLFALNECITNDNAHCFRGQTPYEQGYRLARRIHAINKIAQDAIAQSNKP